MRAKCNDLCNRIGSAITPQPGPLGARHRNVGHHPSPRSPCYATGHETDHRGRHHHRHPDAVGCGTLPGIGTMSVLRPSGLAGITPPHITRQRHQFRAESISSVLKPWGGGRSDSPGRQPGPAHLAGLGRSTTVRASPYSPGQPGVRSAAP